MRPGGLVSSCERGAYEIKGGRRGEGLESAVIALRSHEAEAMTHGKPAYARAIPWPAWCWRCEMANIVGRPGIGGRVSKDQ